MMVNAQMKERLSHSFNRQTTREDYYQRDIVYEE